MTTRRQTPVPGIATLAGTAALAALLALAACRAPARGGHAPAEPPAPAAGAPGAVLAAVTPDRLLTVAGAGALLERHGARPFAVHLLVAGGGGEFRDAPERAGPHVLDAARATASHIARQTLCSTGARLASWSIELPRRWPDPPALNLARTVLAHHGAARRALAEGDSGDVVSGVHVVVPAARLAGLAREPAVARVDTATAASAALDPRARLPVPRPPEAAALHDLPADLRALGAEGLLRRIRAAAAEPRECPPGPPRPPGPPGAPRVDTLPAPRPGELPPTIPPRVHPAFRAAVRAVGALRPGEPVELLVRVDADAVVDTAVLTVVLPELADAWAAAGAGGGEALLDRRATGERYPALDSVAGPIRPETPLLLRRRVTFPAPGWYQVSAVVRARTRPVPPVPLPTVDEAFAGLWIWIDEEGGFTAAAMDPTRYPPGSASGAGPVRPARRDRMAALLDSARMHPATRAAIAGTVRGPDGAPVAGARVTAHAYVEHCPGRAAGPAARARTDADGRFTLELGAWPEESFLACVAVHADPPPGTRLRSRSLRAELRFLRHPGAPAALDLGLSAATDDVPPLPPWPSPVAAAAAGAAPAYAHVEAVLRADVTGDGADDVVELSANAEVTPRGEPIWEHAHRWRVVVRSGCGAAFVVFEEFVPAGEVRVRLDPGGGHPAGTPAALVVAWRSREEWGERRLRYDAASGAFVTESVVQVAWP
jgi:hypothetical protein